MELVDPFIPQPKPTLQRTQGVASQPSKQAHRSQLAKYRPDVGTFRAALPLKPQPTLQAQHATHAPILQPSPVPKKTFTAPAQRTSKLKAFAQTTAVLIWALALGLGIYSQTIGKLAIATYALVALTFRLSSQASFILALCAFVGIVVTQAVKPETNIAANFAVYAFLLLVVGSISLWLEVRQQSKWSKRPRPGKYRKR
jgi:hypothetical protein